MLQQDPQQHLRKNVEVLKAVFDQLLPEQVAQFQRHGNAVLEPAWLAAVAVCCFGWVSKAPLADRVEVACTVVGEVTGVETTVTRQGLLKALGTCGQTLVNLIIEQLSSTLPTLKGEWTRQGMVDFAVDGTKEKAPRTAANQQMFAASQSTTARTKRDAHRQDRKRQRCAKAGRPLRGRRAKPAAVKQYKSGAAASKAATVQVLLTVFWHLNSELPFRWLATGTTGSERLSVQSVIADLPRNARLIGDAEYVGYPLWSTIINSGRSFLFRVGSNITFLKNLGTYHVRDGLVTFWPNTAMAAGQPPLTLQLIKLHTGRKAIYLVTNELDLPAQRAAELYKQRWGIEVFFRSVKQSCARGTLHCRTPENVLTELNWTLLGLWAALFLGKQTLQQQGTPLSRLSPVKVLRAFTSTIQRLADQHHTDCLTDLLTTALIADESHRTSSKHSHDYPRKKKHKRCGAPHLQSATKLQKQTARKLGLYLEIAKQV